MKDPELAKSAKSLAAHQERLLQGQPWNTMKALVRLSSASKHSQGGAWHSAKNVAHTDAEHKSAMCTQVCAIPMKVRKWELGYGWAEGSKARIPTGKS